jgi:hypothetical protein
MCHCRRVGRERPSPFAHRLRPRAQARGSLTPQLSQLSPSSALEVSIVLPRCPPVSWLCREPLAFLLETKSLGSRLTQDLYGISGCLRGHYASEPRAVLGVQGSSLRSDHPRTAPSGLDGACALAGWQLRDGRSLRPEWSPGEASVRKSPAVAFYGIGGRDVRHGSAVPGVTPSSISSFHILNVVASGKPAHWSLRPGRGQATGARPQVVRIMPASGPHPAPRVQSQSRRSSELGRGFKNNRRHAEEVRHERD